MPVVDRPAAQPRELAGEAGPLTLGSNLQVLQPFLESHGPIRLASVNRLGEHRWVDLEFVGRSEPQTGFQFVEEALDLVERR